MTGRKTLVLCVQKSYKQRAQKHSWICVLSKTIEERDCIGNLLDLLPKGPMKVLIAKEETTQNAIKRAMTLRSNESVSREQHAQSYALVDLWDQSELNGLLSIEAQKNENQGPLVQEKRVTQNFVELREELQRKWAKHPRVKEVLDSIKSAMLEEDFRALDLFPAFIHSSFAHQFKSLGLSSNERYEFLGDSVLELWASELLYHHFQELDEGKLSFLRSSLVNTKRLASFCRLLNAQSVLCLGHGEIKAKGEQRESLQADLFEAILGLIYLQCGHKSAFFFMDHIFSSYRQKYEIKMNFEDLTQHFDPRTKLQILTQAEVGEIPTFQSKKGPLGGRTVVVSLCGNTLGEKSAKSNKEATLELCRLLLQTTPWRAWSLKEFKREKKVPRGEFTCS